MKPLQMKDEEHVMRHAKMSECLEWKDSIHKNRLNEESTDLSGIRFIINQRHEKQFPQPKTDTEISVNGL